MRPRKRANWPLIVYRYWVEPECDTWERLPNEVKQEAQAMRALWNHLVNAFAQRQSAYHNALTAQQPTAPADNEPGSSSRPATSRKPSPLVARELQQAFLQNAQRVSKESPVTWANKQFVTTQFFATLTRFFKKLSNAPQQRNGEFHDIHFQHRFTEGGIPVEQIFGHSRRLSLAPVSPEAFSLALPQHERKRQARTIGEFQVNNYQLRFRTILHRPFPPRAYLKAAALVGKRVIKHGYLYNGENGHPTPSHWSWSLQLTLEVPPMQLSTTEQHGASASLLVRCQLIDDQRLCLGILTDSTGREEALILPEDLLSSWQHKRTLQQQADRLLERTKQQLQALPPPERLSTSVQHRLSHLNAARAPGLWRLLAEVEHESDGGEVAQILRQWADSSTKLLREARGVEQRYLGYRDWFYHNLAQQLCRQYQQLVVTIPETQTPSSRRSSPETPVVSESQTYRHLAAPARFLSFLQQAADKTGTSVQHDPRLGARLSSVSDSAIFVDPVQRGES